MSTDKPLAGHQLLRWRQTTMIEGLLSSGGIDHPQDVIGCSCGERGVVGLSGMAMWFLGHCLDVLGADVGLPDGFGRAIDDEEAQRLWFSEQP